MVDRNNLPREHAAKDLRDGLSAGAVLDVLRRRKLLVVMPTLLLVAAAAVVAWLWPPRYRSEAILAYEREAARAEVDPGMPVPELPSRLGEFKQVLHGRELLTRVAQDLELHPEGDEPLPREVLHDLRSGITMRLDSEETLAVGFEGRDPQRVGDVASRLAPRFIETLRSERERRAESRAAFLEAQLGEVRSRLDEQQAAIEDYKERWFREIPEQAGTNLGLLGRARDRLRDVSAAINEEESRLAAIRREMSELERQGVSTRLGKSPAEARLEDLEMELRQLRRRYTDQHPDVVRARAELAELEEAIEDGAVGAVTAPEYTDVQLRYLELGAEREAIEERLSRLSGERRALLGDIATFEQRIQSGPHHERVLADMERELATTRERYGDLQDELQEARLAERAATSEQATLFRILEPSVAPSAPFAPNRPRIVLMGLLAGLGLGFGLAFVAEQADRTVRTAGELEGATGLAALAVIPAEGVSGGRSGDEPMVALLDEPQGFSAEQYRILATKLIRANGAPRSSSVLVTSPMGGEGKTTTAVNLSLALSELVEEEVLLVDADLGRPSVHRFLDVFQGNGLKRLLAEPDTDPARFVRRHAGISIIEAGPFSPETRTALASPLGQRIFQRLRERYPYVVVDAPPVLAVAEGLILQQMVDSILLVVRAGTTPGEVIDRALDSLDLSRLAGCVLNGVDRPREYGQAYPYYQPTVHAAAGGAGR